MDSPLTQHEHQPCTEDAGSAGAASSRVVGNRCAVMPSVGSKAVIRRTVIFITLAVFASSGFVFAAADVPLRARASLRPVSTCGTNVTTAPAAIVPTTTESTVPAAKLDESAAVISSSASQTQGRACFSVFDWPVREPDIVRQFEAPETPWSAGHRGVDLAAQPGTALLAPAGGTISFAGQVAGKSVVSIRHDALISSFEPAQTDLPVGTLLDQGQIFGQVQGGSDHCGETCVHWGVRSGENEYVDPAALVAGSRIVLKAQ